ncbi:MAG: transcriptional regulatory protein-like protein [Gammaproteobacteria bacterium]|nr:transcriptional regulatory protein-like protein [Gammaproteobacteria bacterium]
MNEPPRKSGPQRIRFEDFEADLRTEELFKSGTKLRLPHQSFCVLAMVLERAGQLVTREELRARLWPAGTLIEYDQRLNAAVNRLREALLDSAEAPRFIETLPKRGYRFIAAVEPGGGNVTTPPEVNIPRSEGPAASPSRPADITDKPPLASKTRSPRKVWFAAAAGLTAIALIAVTVAVMTGRSPTRSAFGRQVVPLASLPGKEIAPTFSPDGSQIAFGWNEGTDSDHQFDLYVKSLGSERLLRLTHHPSRWISSAWSPDGSTIAFLRQTDEGAGIFVIPALGGSERSIVTNGVAVGYIQISWSPDGRRLAYSAYGPTGAPQVNIVSLETANTRPVSPAPECLNAADPAFSPDGKQLALVCISSSAVYTVYVLGLVDGSVRALATMLGEPQGLSWAADGSRLILSNDAGDGGELWQLTLSGEREQLPFGEDGSAPTVAARGGRMAYVRGRKTVDIWRADLTAAQPEESAAKLIYSTRTQVVPRYSRDGMHIAFQSNRSGSVEIWMTDAQGGDLDRLTSFNGPLASAPSWCSDGKRIAFDSRVSGISAIYIEDINERVPHKLVTSSGNLSHPAWSEDCRWLFAIDGNNVLYRIASSGGPAERFTDHLSSYAVVVAERLVFNVLDSEGVVLWSKPVGGGPQAPLERMPRVSYEDSWAATPTGIYYTDSGSKPVSVNFYELASRSTRRLMTLKQTPIPGTGPGISVSPDGRWLLYGQAGDESSEIMLAPDR